MKETQILLNQLVNDLKNVCPSSGFKKKFWGTWTLFFILTAVLTYIASVMYPNDIYLPHNLSNPQFWMEVSFWFILALGSARLSYVSSIPGEATQKLEKFTGVMAVLVTLAILFHTSFTSLYLDFLTEFNVSQGPCGFFIFTIGAVWSVAMVRIMKSAAPTNLVLTGVSIALSTGSATTLFMHLFCRHESSSHIFMWHFTPLILIVLIASKISKKILRW